MTAAMSGAAMSGTATSAAAKGPPEALAARIRAGGQALDHELIKEVYGPLLETQPTAGVEVERDLVYGADERHRLDLYRPAARGAVRGVLAFFHGGGFIRGDKQQRSNFGYRFAREGFLVLVPNYRLAPRHRWPAGAEDVIAVHEWWRANADEHGAGAQGAGARSAGELPFFVGGESAGAAHVALATLVRRFHPAGGLRIRGAILISGPYNAELEWLARLQFGVATPDPRNEPYFGSDPSTYAGQSTVALVDAKPFPLFMSFAELDLLQMQVQAGELFARLVARHGFQPELHLVRNHNHLTQVYALNTGDESLAAPLLDFLRREAGRP